ncbi:unnamed protein product [Phytophthora fragariaefolia]|uniref:Unnamed protein product n=1 Tax=Phytophthora fragariaefolia TaxID=1490495 RepID=A0A9W6X8I8_9STRA|nr:unnamed protein product [Phytophthora fragariaefolia]
MKFISQGLATVALIAASVGAIPDGIELGEVFGGTHGEKYSDLSMVKSGQIVKAVRIRTDEHVNGVGIIAADVKGDPTVWYHGGDDRGSETLTFGRGEYVIGIEAHWGKCHSHTCISYIKLTTNGNITLEGGTKTTKVGTDSAPEGYQLGGFQGTTGKELDSVGAIWVKIDASDDSDSSL